MGIFELALVTYLQTISGDKLGHLTFWLIGSLSSSRVNWFGVLTIMPFVVIGIIITYLYSRDLNLFTLGEDQAQHLGVNLERSKIILMISGAFLTGAAVSISGLNRFHRFNDSSCYPTHCWSRPQSTTTCFSASWALLFWFSVMA